MAKSKKKKNETPNELAKMEDENGLVAQALHFSGGGVSVASLASPAFTGTPTAPTPAFTDSSTKLATTAFVKTVSVPTDPAHVQIGAPTTGAHVTGEVFIDANGAIWACQAGGTPGTWFAAGAGVELAEAELASDFAMLNAVTDVTGLSITFIAPARPFVLELSIPMSTFNVTSQNSQVWIADSANTVIHDGYLLTGSGTLAGIPYFTRARLPKVGGANAYPITPGTSYTFKVRQSLSSTAAASITTNSGRDRPILRAVTC